jgi:hypothetical protein
MLFAEFYYFEKNLHSDYIEEDSDISQQNGLMSQLRDADDEDIETIGQIPET